MGNLIHKKKKKEQISNLKGKTVVFLSINQTHKFHFSEII